MGSLEKRIREAMAKRAADPAVRAAEVAAIEAQINQAKAEKERAQQYKIATKQEAARRAAWDAKLKDLLKLVGAREQLAAIRKVWGAGRIDRKPEQVFDMVAMMSCTSKKISNSMDGQFTHFAAEMMGFAQ